MLTWIVSALLGTSATWAGHHVVWSQVHVPLLGDRVVRSDAWVLAEVHEDGRVIRWSERPCRLAMGKVAGVQTRMPEATLGRLLPTEVRMQERSAGAYAGNWTGEWSDADVDGDGHPGVTLQIDVPLCSGQVYVSMHSVTRGEARRFGSDLLGETKVDVAQQILGASNPCLLLGGRDSMQAQRGVFRYAPVEATSCADVHAWPNAAPE